MHYYEKHLGDYIKDTVSLSMLEDGAYNRLIDQCYQCERPLPLDRKEIYRLARATSTPERKAVDYVVGKFFTETPDGYVQKRIDLEIAHYQEKQRKAKASADARWSRSKKDANAYANASETHMQTPCETDAHQAPSTNPQSKPSSTPQPFSTEVGVAGVERAGCSPGEISKAMRSAGVPSQPADPRLIAIAAQGVPLETVMSACAEARRSKPNESIGVGYVVAILERWAKEASAVNALGARPPPAGQASQKDQQRQELIDRISGGSNANRTIIDI